MKRYIVIDTDCESDVWFDNSENKILHYEEIEEILEKQDTKWQKLKEWLKKAILRNKDNIISKNDYENVLVIMQELEAEDE